MVLPSTADTSNSYPDMADNNNGDSFAQADKNIEDKRAFDRQERYRVHIASG